MLIQLGEWIERHEKESKQAKALIVHEDGTGEIQFAMNETPDKTWTDAFDEEAKRAELPATVVKDGQRWVFSVRCAPERLQTMFDSLHDVVHAVNDRGEAQVRAAREAAQAQKAKQEALKSALLEAAKALNYAKADFGYPEPEKRRRH
jgi:hypothetical protein